MGKALALEETIEQQHNITDTPDPERRSMVGYKAIARAVFKHRLSRAGAIIIILFSLMAILAPWISPHHPHEQDLYNVLSGPTASHWLGTDSTGRDLLSRIIYGARVSMAVAFFATSFAAAIGAVLGLIAGFKGGWADMVIMRLVDIVMSIPALVIVLVFSAALGPGLTNIIIAISLMAWTGFARQMRGQVLQVRSMPYVEASKATGASNIRLIMKHILPNSLAPIIVNASLMMGFSIAIEAGAAFLGLGIQPPTPSWGQELKVGYNYLEMVPLYSIVPGIMITLAILSFNFLGDGLRDAMDPHLRGEGKKQ